MCESESKSTQLSVLHFHDFASLGKKMYCRLAVDYRLLENITVDAIAK